MKVIGIIAMVLVIVGGLNWGLVVVFDWNLVTKVLGDGALAKIVYDLVGLSAIYLIFAFPKFGK